MARRATTLPGISSRELIENVGVVRAGDAGGGLRSAAAQIGSLAAGATNEAARLQRTDEAEAEARAVADARTAGREAVTIDEGGNVIVKPLPANDTSANRAFNAAAEQGFISQFTNAQQSRAAAYQAQSAFDPASFSAIWKGHTDGVLATVPETFKSRAREILADLGQRHGDSIILRTAERDRALANQAWSDRLGKLEIDMQAFAAAGDTSSGAYLKTVRDYEESLRGGITAKFINEDSANMRREAAANEGEALALSKKAYDAYLSAGRGEAGIKAADQIKQHIIGDPELGLPEARRYRIANLIDSRIADQESLRRAEVSQLRDEVDGERTKLRLGYPVSETTLFDYSNRLAAAGEHKLAQNLREEFRIQKDVSQFGKLPLAEQEARIRPLEALLSDGKGGPEDALRLTAFKQAYADKGRALKDDPLTYARRAHRDLIGDLPEIEWTKQETLIPALQTRVAASEKLSAREGVYIPPLTKLELGNLQSALTVANADQKAELASTLYQGLGSKVLPRVFNEIKAGGKEQEAFVAGAAISAQNMDLARRIYRGIDVLKTNQKAAPENNIVLRTQFDNHFGDALALRPDARSMYEEAALAVYADMSNAAGDLKGALDTKRLRSAMNDVTGPILTKKAGWTSHKLIAPAPNMKQAQFDDLMDSLTDQDLGAMPPKAADGKPVTAEMIRNNANLVSVADGVYEVRFGDGRQYAIDPVTGGPYRLDLKPLIGRAR